MSGHDRSVRGLDAWQNAMDLAREVVQLSAAVDWSTCMQLCAELVRDAYLIPALIADGRERSDRAAEVQLLDSASGRLARVYTYLYLARDLSILSLDQVDEVLTLLERVSGLLAGYRTYKLAAWAKQQALAPAPPSPPAVPADAVPPPAASFQAATPHAPPHLTLALAMVQGMQDANFPLPEPLRTVAMVWLADATSIVCPPDADAMTIAPYLELRRSLAEALQVLVLEHNRAMMDARDLQEEVRSLSAECADLRADLRFWQGRP